MVFQVACRSQTRYLVCLINTNNEVDFLRDDTGSLALFHTATEAGAKAGLAGEESPRLFDLDKCQRLLQGQGGIRLNTQRANLILGCLDLLDDLWRSLGSCQIKDWLGAHPRVYDKIFWSCNLPVLTPPGTAYRAFLSSRETQELCKLLESLPFSLGAC